MKKCAVSSLLILLAASTIVGCAGMGKGAKPEELVMKQTQAFAADFLAVNVDKIPGYISEKFTSERVPDKAALVKSLDEAKAAGRVERFAQMIKDDHGKVDLQQAKVALKGDAATVYPIGLSSDRGALTVELTYKKDPDKVWRVTGIKIEGL
jgi:hypothetical protein